MSTTPPLIPEGSPRGQHDRVDARDAVCAPAVDRLLCRDLLEDLVLTDAKEFDLYNRWLLLADEAFRNPPV